MNDSVIKTINLQRSQFIIFRDRQYKLSTISTSFHIRIRKTNQKNKTSFAFMIKVFRESLELESFSRDRAGRPLEMWPGNY